MFLTNTNVSLYTNTSNITLSNITIESSFAYTSGGVFYINDEASAYNLTLTLINNTGYNVSSTTSGGIIYNGNDFSNISIIDSNFSTFFVTDPDKGSGGGIYIS